VTPDAVDIEPLDVPREGIPDVTHEDIDDAVAVQDAGAFAVVLEMVPADLASKVTKIVRIPTIGVGAGAGTDGQVLVWTDMAGMTGWTPRFSRSFGHVGDALRAAAADFCTAVRAREFPGPEHSF